MAAEQAVATTGDFCLFDSAIAYLDSGPTIWTVQLRTDARPLTSGMPPNWVHRLQNQDPEQT